MGRTACRLRGETEKGDIQKTDEKGELGDEIGRETGERRARWNGQRRK